MFLRRAEITEYEFFGVGFRVDIARHLRRLRIEQASCPLGCFREVRPVFKCFARQAILFYKNRIPEIQLVSAYINNIDRQIADHILAKLDRRPELDIPRRQCPPAYIDIIGP
ncbi:hypothetical protein D3C87_1606980 [compost metagenome]